jgi:hypothetical protein
MAMSFLVSAWHGTSLAHAIQQQARGGPSPQHSPASTRNLLISNMLAPPEAQASAHFGRHLRVITLFEYCRHYSF